MILLKDNEGLKKQWKLVRSLSYWWASEKKNKWRLIKLKSYMAINHDWIEELEYKESHRFSVLFSIGWHRTSRKELTVDNFVHLVNRHTNTYTRINRNDTFDMILLEYPLVLFRAGSLTWTRRSCPCNVIRRCSTFVPGFISKRICSIFLPSAVSIIDGFHVLLLRKSFNDNVCCSL
jgi:hypothetical protein